MMKLLLLAFLTYGIFLTGTATAQTNGARKKTPKKPAAQMNDKIFYEPDAELLGGMREKIRIVESKKDWAHFNRQTPAVNPAQTRSAYIAQFNMENEPDALLDVIVVSDKAAGKMFEIRGIEDFSWRPFSNFKWINNDVLRFEQWVSPTSGGRYQVNIKTGKVVAAGYVRSN